MLYVQLISTSTRHVEAVWLMWDNYCRPIFTDTPLPIEIGLDKVTRTSRVELRELNGNDTDLVSSTKLCRL